MTAVRALVVLLGLLVVAGCESGKAPGGGTAVAQKPAPARGRPVFVPGPTGGADVAPFIRAELERARREHHGVLVYVGATWCEPCRNFHAAVERGELDQLLAGVRMIEFDLDRDRDALGRAGYLSDLIPLFALPKPDGTSSSNRIEGSIKGPDAVEQNLVPRLKAFLAGLSQG